MNQQLTLFDISECTAEPWEIPATLRRVEMIVWLRESAYELAHIFCNERPKFSFLDNDLVHDFRHGKFPNEFVRKWVEKKYQEAMKHV